MGQRELHLDGGEIAVIKALGLSGSDMTGDDLMTRCDDLAEAELIDTLKSLMMLGYVVSDRSSFHNKEELKSITFRVNSGYIKDLREALSPQQAKPRSKRVRRE
ncbi:MAG: hypothetical protein QOE70_5086 [Chthoniobacter sp.]|jgi:hypothetical protein|nr:hypothetical protein [Chthoniobacter sp.]